MKQVKHLPLKAQEEFAEFSCDTKLKTEFDHAIELCAVVLDSRETVCPISCEGCCPVPAVVGKNKQSATLPHFAQKFYSCHKVCERHFAEKELRTAIYPGSNQRLVIPGACLTLFLNEVIERKRDDIRHIREDHSYKVNAQNEPTTVAEICEPTEICVPGERDNDLGVFATTSSASGAYQTPSTERGNYCRYVHMTYVAIQ
ncbi:hypothetical protein CBL_20152 [Carabus blaptoides fortunei]